MGRPKDDGDDTRIRSALIRRIGIDTRALAALRISLGVLLFVDLVLRSLDLVAFYTDDGVLPRSALREAFPAFSTLTFHTVSGEPWVQALLFLVAGLFALALVLGYRTKLSLLLSLVFLVSLQARNPMILNAGDSVLRRLLFWSLFLPLGERWSIDGSREEKPGRRVTRIASAALLVQVVLIYTVNGLLKLRGDLWVRGQAIQYVFGLDQLTVLLGDTLGGYPLLLETFGHLWMALILGSVLLVLSTGWVRAAFVALFVVMHLGMLLTMRLGPFPLISAAALLPFLPPVVWDRVEQHLSTDALPRIGAGRRHRRSGQVHSGSFSELSRRARRGTQRLTPALVAVFLAFVLVWNAASIGVVAMPAGVTSAVDPEERRWDMFAPEPRGDDGWYVVPARTESGQEVDALSGSPVDWRRPADLADTYPSHRWLLYLLDVRHAGDDVRGRFGEYLCERWNAEHEDELRSLTVYYVREQTRLDEPDPTERVRVTNHTCGVA